MIFPRPWGRVQQAMQKELYKVGMAARAPPPHWAYLQKGNAHSIVTQTTPCWNIHTAGSLMLPSLCILLRDNYSWKTVTFYTTAICYFSAFISTQADKVKKLFRACISLLWHRLWYVDEKTTVFFVLALLPEQAFKTELSYLRGIQKGLRNDGATWSDLISRGEAGLHPLCCSTAAEQYIRQPVRKHGNYNVFLPGRS